MGKYVANGAIFNNSGGRRIADGIWRLAWRNYLKLGDHKHAAEIMWDLKKAFETLDRDTLWEMGLRFDYPMDVLRVSLGTYAMTRRLQLEQGIVSKPMKGSRGICAGSAFATFEFKLYLLQFASKLVMLRDHLQVSIHVDDIHMHISASTKDEALELSTKVANFAQQELEDSGLMLAGEKEAILATEPEIAVAIGKRLGRHIPKPDVEAIKLGVDYQLDKRKPR